MNIVPRIPITTAMITATNVTDSADYNASTTYAVSDVVKDPATYLEYESVQSSNTGHNPATDDGTWWAVAGYANSRRMVDGLLLAKTENATSIVLTLDLGQLATSLVCFNVSAESVSLEIKEGATVTYTETVQMVRTDDVENIWDYMFTDPEYKTVAIFPSFPGVSGATIKLTVSAPSGTAKIGEAIFGYGRYIGPTLAGTTPRLKDYSVQDENAWGEMTIVERSSSRNVDFTVGLNPQENDRIMRILEENRAKLCAFYPSDGMEHYGLTVAGFLTEYAPSLTHRGITPVEITVQGIVTT